MPSRSISSPSRRLKRGATLLLAAAGLALVQPAATLAFEIVEDPAVDSAAAAPADPGAGYDLYLDVSINGVKRDVIAPVHMEPDGSLSMLPDDLTKAGLLAPGPDRLLTDERVALASLADVTYSFDASNQTIDFTAPDSARARLIIDAAAPAEGARINDAAGADPDIHASDFGAVLNYDVYASATRLDGEGIVTASPSGTFAARAFGPFGLIEQSFSVLSTPFDIHRLETSWSYSDPQSMRTYRAGDLVTGALGWTRPTRLGGLQLQNDFGLRSDIVTFPTPTISGSAALPSSVDIYVNNSNRFSSAVPSGPFDIVDVPVITGAGTVQLIVRDPNGKQVETSADYFASTSLLRPGLWDYSAEAGFARTHFGARGDGYDRRLMASTSVRAGVSDWLTWEGHAEGGIDLLNAGTGATVALGRLGVGEFSAAASKTRDAAGLQVTGSVQLGFGPVAVGARVQRSFGHYDDIGSVTAPGTGPRHAASPKALYQFSLSLPAPFEGGHASLSYTQVDPDMGTPAEIVAASYNQRLLKSDASASAYYDLEHRNFGINASFWVPIGGNLATGATARRTPNGTAITANFGHAGGNEVGDFGWLVQVDRGAQTNFTASANTRLPAADVRARLGRFHDTTGVSGEVSGSIAALDGGVFFAAPIDDAFAVVDVGAAGVPVRYQNKVVGETGHNGKLLVPGLVSYEKNRVSIDPTKLPLDKIVDNTASIVSPARHAGVVVSFGDRTAGGNALVTFRDPAGAYLPLASSGTTGTNPEPFVVGYDGQALLEGLAADNSVSITLPDGKLCTADVPYAPQGDDLVTIPDVVCRPQGVVAEE